MGIIDLDSLKSGLNNNNNKNKIARFLIITAFIVIAWTIFMEVVKAVGMVGVAMGGISMTLSSTIPRPIIIWWQRQSAIVEFTVAILLGVVVGTGAGGWAVLSFTAVALFVTSMIKMLNLAHAFTYGDTLYEHMCKKTTRAWPTEIELWWFFGGAKAPLKETWKWDKEKVGPMGWKFLISSIWHILKRNHEYDFFSQPEGKPMAWVKWWNADRYYYELEVYETKKQRVEYLKARHIRKVELVRRYESLTNNNSDNWSEVASVAAALLKIQNEEQSEKEQ